MFTVDVHYDRPTPEHWRCVGRD